MWLCRYGGQFAYVEIINSMRQPGRFTSAVSASTPVMSVAYLALGAIGYWSQGVGVQEIIIFGTGFDTWSRIAAGAILFQARPILPAFDFWSVRNLLYDPWILWASRCCSAGVHTLGCRFMQGRMGIHGV